MIVKLCRLGSKFDAREVCLQNSPPDGDAEQQDKDEVCALAVLFGQGDVYIVVPPNFSATTPCTERAALFGPLRMRPCSLDNLGAESCSLTVLQVQPPVLVMASATGGTTYHGLLLTVPRNFDFNISGAASDVDSLVGAEECGKFLRLVEKVKLNISMGVGATSEVEDPSAFACPLHLFSDPASPSRYYCSHEGGLHCVTLPLVQELQKFNANQCTVEEAMKALPKNGVPSRIHYLLCTQLGIQQSPQPLQGFAPLPLTSAGLALLPRPTLVPLPTVVVPPDSRAVFSDSLHVLEGKVAPTSEHEVNFEERVRCLLQHNCTQPLLRLPPGTKLSNRDFLDLLKKSVAVLRTEYLAKLNVVHEEIKHKRSMLEKTQEVRLRQIQELKLDVLNGLEKQKRIRVKMEDAMELGKENIRRERLSQPEISEAEEQMSRNLEKHKLKVDVYKDTMAALTARMNTVLQTREETMQGGAEVEYFSEKEVKDYRATCVDVCTPLELIECLRTKSYDGRSGTGAATPSTTIKTLESPLKPQQRRLALSHCETIDERTPEDAARLPLVLGEEELPSVLHEFLLAQAVVVVDVDHTERSYRVLQANINLFSSHGKNIARGVPELGLLLGREVSQLDEAVAHDLEVVPAHHAVLVDIKQRV
ncbi:hypothetical protein B566_EDAN008343 [Ephemera danica]|nr:hypothetical protein B566_EDAN008343 [Ephemera danica]